MKNYIPVFAILTFLLIILRIIINENPAVISIVAIINILALLMVVYSVTEQTKSAIAAAVKTVGVPSEIVLREIESIKQKVNIIVYVTFAVVSTGYLLFIRSGLGNDIIAIIALGISLSDMQIVAGIKGLYLKHYQLGVKG